MASRASSYLALLLLLLVLALGAYVGIGLYLSPTVAGVSPNPAKAGDVLTIRGAQFSSDIWENAVLLGNQSARLIRASATTLEAEVPILRGLGSAATKVPLRVVVGGRVSGSFDVTIAPTLAVAEVSVPEPSPSPETTPEPATPSPTTAAPPRPRPVPSPSPAGPRVADLLAEGAAAESARHYAAAVSLYQKATLAEPQNAKAQAALKTAQLNEASLLKTFQPGRTLVEGPVAGRGNFKDFDTREVAVHKAPEVQARVDIEITPAHVVAGDAFALKVWLHNEGMKAIKIAAMKVTTTANGKASEDTRAPRTAEVGPRARVPIHEAQGIWKDGLSSWNLDVQVLSAKGDSYRNQAVWK